MHSFTRVEPLKLFVALACLFTTLALSSTASAQGVSQPCLDRSVCGEVSPLIPMQSTEAVHMGLVWKKGVATPKILFHARFSEYTANDVADPAAVDAAIAAGALTNGVNDFNNALRDVLNPSFRNGTDPRADSFQRLTYGGFLLRQGLSMSVPTRIKANRTMERALLLDLGHPDAFKSNGKFHTALLDKEDFALNRAAFKEVGFSAGLNYNIYCNARVMLADGRVYVFGGHDMQSNNGLYKVQIFDPETETWAPRSRPCTRENWARDPFGRELFARDPNARFYPGCNPLEIQSTQPSDPSDMKYKRWYPTAIPLPNNTILILGGNAQDASVGPDPQAAAKGRQGIPQTDTAFSATRITQVVPEVYDPETDRNIALENARKTFPLYPQAEVVQTGPGRNDWKVCTMGGLDTEDVGGGSKFFGPYPASTWCLDVLAALRDPDRDSSARNHWELLDTASESRPYCCPGTSLLEIDENGRTVSHKWFLFTGQDNVTRRPTATIEMIDFTDPLPRWRRVGSLIQPSTTSKAVALPDGKVFIANGLNPLGRTFEERAGLRYQMFDPNDGSTRAMAKTTVPRGLHGTAVLLPDATVFVAGENREVLVRPDDPAFPMDGFPVGDPDLGVPNGQIFRPPYLFNTDGSLAARPVITEAPEEISFREHFEVSVAGGSDQIASVVIIRSDHSTHNLETGSRYVKLAFRAKDEHRGRSHKRSRGDRRKEGEGQLRVITPRLPAQAIPGVYMLFVLDNKGVPSVGRQIRLIEEEEEDKEKEDRD